MNNISPVVLVDTLIAFFDGNENDSVAMRSFLAPLRRLADAGACVIILHHTGKTGDLYRGSSDFKSGLDIGYKIRNMGGTRLGCLELKAFKRRLSVDERFTIHHRDGQFFSNDVAATARRVGAWEDPDFNQWPDPMPTPPHWM